MARKPYPTDVKDDEWEFVAPYLALIRDLPPETVPRRLSVSGALVFPLIPEPNLPRVVWDIGPPPVLMPLELRGIRAINGLHSSDRVQRIPWGSACPGRCADALHCNRSATK
jgi:hypothetical protein